ncbi:RNA-directed DNA polymerase (Reverse transcriptase), Ribonuclease [Salix suchowensis]|nr:RNA-directed DNA polymerase (Reverse transcriptase), Ribonuclease [Salix suchowensis]
MLIICQVKGEWKTKDEKLKLYQNYLVKLASEFEEVKFTHMSRDKNQFADALATLASMVQIMVVTYRDWHEMLPYALHAYRTTVRTSTWATPYALVYGMEAVTPLEVEIPSLKVLKDVELEESEWARLRFEQLNLVDEKRLAAICHH